MTSAPPPTSPATPTPGDIAGYAQTAMAWANGTGLVTGTSDTTLSPTGSAVRGQVATILMRFLEHVAV